MTDDADGEKINERGVAYSSHVRFDRWEWGSDEDNETKLQDAEDKLREMEYAVQEALDTAREAERITVAKIVLSEMLDSADPSLRRYFGQTGDVVVHFLECEADITFSLAGLVDALLDEGLEDDDDGGNRDESFLNLARFFEEQAARLRKADEAILKAQK